MGTESGRVRGEATGTVGRLSPSNGMTCSSWLVGSLISPAGCGGAAANGKASASGPVGEARRGRSERQKRVLTNPSRSTRDPPCEPSPGPTTVAVEDETSTWLGLPTSAAAGGVAGARAGDTAAK